MNNLLISAVPASTIIMILVQVAKRCGIRSQWSPVLAIFFGVTYTGAAYVVRMFPGTLGIYEALGTGITLGLTASGLYSGSKAMCTRAIPGVMNRATVRPSGTVVVPPDGVVQIGDGTGGQHG